MKGFIIESRNRKNRPYYTIRVCEDKGNGWVKTGHFIGFYFESSMLSLKSLYRKIKQLNDRGLYQIDQTKLIEGI
jgi:hypothetical protein